MDVTSKQLDERERIIDAKEEELEKRGEAAAVQIGDANRHLLQLQADSIAHAEWGQILEGLNEGTIVLTGEGRADWKLLPTDAARPIAPNLQARVTGPAPPWAEQGLKAYSALITSLSEVSKLEVAVQGREKQLTQMIEQAGPVLSPAQEEVVSEAASLLRQSVGSVQQAARQLGEEGHGR